MVTLLTTEFLRKLISTLWILLGFLSKMSMTADTIRITTILQAGFTDLNETSNLVGFIPDLVKELFNRLNINYRLSLVKDGTYGARLNNREFSGLIGEVLRNEADLIAAPLTMTADRETVIDFSHEIVSTGLVMVVKAPDQKAIPYFGNDFTFFFAAFDIYVWSVGVFFWILASVAIVVNCQANPREELYLDDSEQYTCLSVFFFTVSTATFQGFRKAPNSIAGRILSINWWIFMGFFVVSYISATFCLILAGNKTTNNLAPLKIPFHRLQTEYRNTVKNISPIWLKGGSTEEFFASSTDPTVTYLKKCHDIALMKHPYLGAVSTSNDVMTLVKSKDNVVGLVESAFADYYINRDKTVVRIGSTLNDVSYALAFPTNSHLKDRINIEIIKLKKIGFIRQLYTKYIGKDFGTCSLSTSSSEIDEDIDIIDATQEAQQVTYLFRNKIPLTLSKFIAPILMFILGNFLSIGGYFLDKYMAKKFEGLLAQTPQQVTNGRKRSSTTSAAVYETVKLT